MDAASATKGFKHNTSATSPHYAYDANGNLTQDNHKFLTFQYNHLNLPNSVYHASDNSIGITYTADGEKLTKAIFGSVRNYVGGIEYLNAALDAIYRSDGRCTPNGATAFHYEYALKDHLGNARVNFRANGTAVTFLEETHYYPFGMALEGLSAAPVTANAYKYNGKELSEDLGLGWYDYGARWYDAAVGRWWSVDPMADNTDAWGPYSYCFNNAIRFVDLWGLTPTYDWNAHERGEKGVYRDEDGNSLQWNEVENHIASGLPQAYYVNDAKISSKRLTGILGYATEIFSKNGYDGLKFNQVSESEAKLHEKTYNNQMFFAIVTKKHIQNRVTLPGMSTIFADGMIGVYSKYKDTWWSWVDINHPTVTQHDGNKDYAAGYIIAHEILHQMIAIAAYYSKGNPFLYPSHTNERDNLNMEGHLVKIPKRPIKNRLQIAEEILSQQKGIINIFKKSMVRERSSGVSR